MTNKKISNFELTTLNYFITRAFLIGITFNSLLNAMKQDSWIIPLLSIIPAIILIHFIKKIIDYEPELNLPQKIVKLFGKKIGYVFIIILILIAYFISLLNYLNLNNFVQSQFLSQTPFYFISSIFALAALYIVNKDINVITRTSNIIFYMSIILLIISFIGLMPAFKLDNLKPFFTSKPDGYISGVNSYYAFNILPMFLLTIIPKNNIENKKIKKILIISYLLSALSLFIIIIQTILVFGYELCLLYEYPEFLVLKHITLISLSSRIESILIIQLIFDIFIFSIFLIYFMSQNTNQIIKFKNIKIINFIFCFLLVIGTAYISKYNIYLDSLMKEFIPISLSIIISFIIAIICIKIKLSK